MNEQDEDDITHEENDDEDEYATEEDQYTVVGEGLRSVGSPGRQAAIGLGSDAR